jgi:hypothetical protein
MTPVSQPRNLDIMELTAREVMEFGLHPDDTNREETIFTSRS